MKLTKKIPARTKTLTVVQYVREFMEMSPTFRRVRGGSRNPMDKCYWCGHAFADGDMMALVQFAEVGGGNKVLCQSCADELEASEKAKGDA
jgi:hypothetical protein